MRRAISRRSRFPKRTIPRSGRITTHYSAAEVCRLLEAVEKVRTDDGHPELLVLRGQLAIEATMGLANFRDDEIDVAIRYGRGRYAGLRSDRLFAVRLVPVCSPSLLRGRSAAAKRAALAAHPLLHDKARRNWRLWLAAQGIDDVDPDRGPSFSDQTFMLRAAALGQGIALAPDALVADDIAADRLIALSDAGWPTRSAYWCVTPETPLEPRKVASFRTWLLAEATRDRRREASAHGRQRRARVGAPQS